MSWIVQEYLWTVPMTPTQKLVALSLANHCHDDGTEARPSQALIAKETGLSERTVRSTLHQLVEADVMRVDRPSTQHRPTCFVFLLPPSVSRRRPAKVTPLAPDRQSMHQTGN